MLNVIFQETTLKIFLNLVTISFWEQLFLVIFTYVMMGELAYLEQPEEDEFDKLIDKSDYGRVFIPALVGGIISSTLRYLEIGLEVSFSLSVLSVLLTIILFGDVFNNSTAVKWIIRAAAFFLLGIIVMICSELLYVPFVIYIGEKSIQEINNNPLFNLALSIPAVVLKSLVLIFLIVKKRSFLRAKVLKVIFESRFLSASTLFILTFDIASVLVALKGVVFDKVLINLSLFAQVSVIIVIFLFPVLNISILIWSIYYVSNKEKERQEKASASIREIMEKIQSSIDENGNNLNQLKLNMLSFNYDFLDVADYLSTNNKKGERLNE